VLQLYSAALVRDRDVQSAELEQIKKELQAAEAAAAEVSHEIVELNLLNTKIDERRIVLSGLLDKLSALNLLTNNFSTTKVRVIDPPTVGQQTYPKILNFLAVGAFIGAFLGAGLALLIDRADMSFRTPLQIQELLRAPVICQVPKIERGKLPAGYKGSHCLVTHLKPLSNSAEAFRSGRAAIMITASQIHGKVFLFTSPQPGDGKSTISSNFALSLAQLGKKVILVDADFRRPRVAQYLGEEPKPGFCDHLNGTPLEDCIRTSTVHNNLMFLPTGGHPKNLGEIVNGIELGSVIDKLRQEFDYVIIDSPPLNPVADSSALASIVDGVYMVIRIRRGGVVAASRARDQLDLVNAKLLGVIVNGLDNNPHYYDHGYYGYNYQRGYGKYYESSSKDLIDV
jgi:capsular exopolysaccharide synthesis family protein